jgi:hypothetical protein
MLRAEHSLIFHRNQAYRAARRPNSRVPFQYYPEFLCFSCHAKFAREGHNLIRVPRVRQGVRHMRVITRHLPFPVPVSFPSPSILLSKKAQSRHGSRGIRAEKLRLVSVTARTGIGLASASEPLSLSLWCSGAHFALHIVVHAALRAALARGSIPGSSGTANTTLQPGCTPQDHKHW